MIIDDGGAACVMASPRNRRTCRREGGWPHRHPRALLQAMRARREAVSCERRRANASVVAGLRPWSP